MVEEGILAETMAAGTSYGWECEALTGNIYRTFKAVLDGDVTTEEAIANVIRSDMRLAKRQMTWFKRNSYIHWGKTSELMQITQQFLQTSNN